MKDFFVNQIFDGSILIATPIAILAGFISFLSPCVLPLVPGYLAYVSGAANTKRRMVLGSLLFIFGFAILFTSYGALFGELGQRITTHSNVITRVLGALTIFFGLVFAFPEKFYRSFKLVTPTRTGLASAPILGFMFGLGWTPCIGPTLGAVQTISFIEASALRGAILSFMYCIGLGAPFLLFALFMENSSRIRALIMKNGALISLVGGIVLIAIGVLQLTGNWQSLMIDLRGTISSFIPVI